MGYRFDFIHCHMRTFMIFELSCSKGRHEMRRKQEHVTKVTLQEIILQMPLPWSRGNKKYRCRCLQSLKLVQSTPV